MNILVTGGTGYIGSHTAVELLNAGHDIVIVDNLSNSSRDVVEKIETITGKSVVFYELDVCDKSELISVFSGHDFDAVMHFAGLKAVGESTQKPLRYYRNNLDSSLSLLETMQEKGVKTLLFSSSATVYGSAPIPYSEESSVGQGITNAYGQTKYMIEQIMSDVAKATPVVQFTTLRYFNPIGAHESGLIGERPEGTPNNLMPYLLQVASGERDKLQVFGSDYDTIDGTGVRDYIHVVDLAKGHVAALEHTGAGFQSYNLGSGHGTSVLEIIQAFEQASGKKIAYEITDRRQGDLPEYYANVAKAEQMLGWKTTKTIEDACRDSWKWQQTSEKTV